MNPERLKGHLDMLLLSVLATQPAHGYAVIERLRNGSGGAFDLPEGTIYPALHRLEAAGLVKSEWATVAGRKRRVYRLAERGSRALADQRQEWRTFAAAVNAVAGGQP